MAGGAPDSGTSAETTYRSARVPLLVPTWLMIGVFLILPVALMAVYSFLT